MTKNTPADDISSFDQMRDEAQVQAHLAKAEALDKFSGLRGRWEKLRQDLLAARAIGDATREDLSGALSLATDSLRRHFGELRALVRH